MQGHYMIQVSEQQLYLHAQAGLTLYAERRESWAYRWGTWTVGAAFGLGAVGDFRYVGLFRRERGTLFAALDTHVYTPLCVALAAAILYLAAI
jgi:hypothetical protein